MLLFAFDPRRPAGGLGDLRNVYETDNREGMPLLDEAGYLLPAIVLEAVHRLGRPQRLQALHLGQRGQPQRMEVWQRCAQATMRELQSPVLISDGHTTYERLQTSLCVLGEPKP